MTAKMEALNYAFSGSIKQAYIALHVMKLNMFSFYPVITDTVQDGGAPEHSGPHHAYCCAHTAFKFLIKCKNIFD